MCSPRRLVAEHGRAATAISAVPAAEVRVSTNTRRLEDEPIVVPPEPFAVPPPAPVVALPSTRRAGRPARSRAARTAAPSTRGGAAPSGGGRPSAPVGSSLAVWSRAGAAARARHAALLRPHVRGRRDPAPENRRRLADDGSLRPGPVTRDARSAASSRSSLRSASAASRFSTPARSDLHLGIVRSAATLPWRRVRPREPRAVR